VHRTEAQIAADQLLEEAVRVVSSAYGFGDDAAFIGDWLVIAELPRLDGTPARYGMFMPGGVLPEHRARGLVAVCGEAVDEQYSAASDDDDPTGV
jgi:hypothetical protein